MYLHDTPCPGDPCCGGKSPVLIDTTPVWKTETICASCQSMSRVASYDRLTGAPTGLAYYYNLAGGQLSAPLIWTPGPCQHPTLSRSYKGLTSTPSVTAGDILRQIQVLCQQTGQVLSESWYNDTRLGVQISKPPGSTVQYIVPDCSGAAPIVITDGSLQVDYLAGTIDGITGNNQSFSTSKAFKADSLKVYLNGQRLFPGIDFSEVGTTGFQLIDAPELNSELIAEYTLLV
ncbi:hypothetical protein CLV58_109201 [Spirosoma oryzae]|uniref:Uncharacterized protein n=1 Tax=Spirosoma oryzae TaxID=1469603 RepID=A0A2T0SYJ4_9BACT|nr:hypothetical protein [Spirosoma oryzae]PRY38474.1 hypothetical protein CLV58_109201 [Spirosoma oryzae]